MPAQSHVIVSAQGAVLVDEVLGNDEDRDALGACRVAFDPGENRVDDIL